MQIVVERPPNYDAIVARFPDAARPGVIFTCGQTIFNPAGIEISGALKCHESVHAQRQGNEEHGILEWWRRYLDEPLFRLEEELLAHRAEYRAFKGWTKDRRLVLRELETIARRLSGPLYGGLITLAQAQRFIVADVDPKKVDRLRRDQAVPA